MDLVTPICVHLRSSAVPNAVGLALYVSGVVGVTWYLLVAMARQVGGRRVHHRGHGGH